VTCTWTNYQSGYASTWTNSLLGPIGSGKKVTFTYDPLDGVEWVTVTAGGKTSSKAYISPA
jgi:hypothetical protein